MWEAPTRHSGVTVRGAIEKKDKSSVQREGWVTRYFSFAKLTRVSWEQEKSRKGGHDRD